MTESTARITSGRGVESERTGSAPFTPVLTPGTGTGSVWAPMMVVVVGVVTVTSVSCVDEKGERSQDTKVRQTDFFSLATGVADEGVEGAAITDSVSAASVVAAVVAVVSTGCSAGVVAAEDAMGALPVTGEATTGDWTVATRGSGLV